MRSRRRDLLIMALVLAGVILFLGGIDFVGSRVDSLFFQSEEASWGISQVEAQTGDPIAGPEFLVGPPKVIITLRLIVPPGGLAGMIVDGTTTGDVSITCAPSDQPISRCDSMNTARLALTDLSNEGVGEVVDIGFIMEGDPGTHVLFVTTVQADDDLGNVLKIPSIIVPFTLP